MFFVALLASRCVHFLFHVFIISTVLMSCKTLMLDVMCIVNQLAAVSFIYLDSNFDLLSCIALSILCNYSEVT